MSRSDGEALRVLVVGGGEMGAGVTQLMLAADTASTSSRVQRPPSKRRC